MRRKYTKKILFLTLLLCFCLHSLPVHAKYSEKYENSLYFQTVRREYNKDSEFGEIGDWIESGNFYYEVLNSKQDKSQKKYITIRRVKKAAVENGVLKIPAEIDGYSVVGIGVFDVEQYPYYPGEDVIRGKVGILENPALLKTVVFAEGIEVIGIGSFERCVNLKQVILPKNLVYIAPRAFFDCKEISELSFPQGIVAGGQSFANELLPDKVTFYSNCTLNFPLCNNLLAQKKTEAYVYYYEKKHFNYSITGYLKKLFIDPQINSLHIKLLWEDGIQNLGGIKELVINGKNTKLHMDDEILSFDVNGIYTVKGANAIKEAKKHDIPYFVKKTGKTQRVKAKRKSGKYKAGWKKVKTTIERHTDNNNWKGKSLKKAVKTKYSVYGCAKKSGKYKKICTTTKNTIKSKYKYIKAVPVKAWD